jgi:putative ABC transport system permease protein
VEIREILSQAQRDEILTEVSFSNYAQTQAENRAMLAVVNIFVYGFIIIISLIAIANVFNTISTNINLRRREFAMLKSVGMSEKGLTKLMNYECIIYGLRALTFGLPISIGFTLLIYISMNQGLDMPFTLPWAGIGISVFSVFFVVFVTMLYAMDKVKKENTIDALKAD